MTQEELDRQIKTGIRSQMAKAGRMSFASIAREAGTRPETLIHAGAQTKAWTLAQFANVLDCEVADFFK